MELTEYCRTAQMPAHLQNKAKTMVSSGTTPEHCGFFFHTSFERRKTMYDPNDPRPDPTREREYGNRWRQGMNDSEVGYFGPVIAVIAALLIGLFLFSNWGGENRPNTQVGQNVERSPTPDTPRNPNSPK
jgi:hypothetical protein